MPTIELDTPAHTKGESPPSLTGSPAALADDNENDDIQNDDDAFGDDFDDFEEGAEDDDFDDFEDGFQQPEPSPQFVPPAQPTSLPYVSP